MFVLDWVILWRRTPSPPTVTTRTIYVFCIVLHVSKRRAIRVFSDVERYIRGPQPSHTPLTVNRTLSFHVRLSPQFVRRPALNSTGGPFADIRLRSLGIALAQPALIQILSNTNAPYNISTPTASLALSALSRSAVASMRTKVDTLVKNRAWLLEKLAGEDIRALGVGSAIGGNDANFVLVPILEKGQSGKGKADNARAHAVYKTLAEEEGVVVRYRGSEPGCAGCLRITVGSEEENETVVRKLGEVLPRL